MLALTLLFVACTLHSPDDEDECVGWDTGCVDPAAYADCVCGCLDPAQQDECECICDRWFCTGEYRTCTSE